MMKKKVLMVCLGNICRSPLAEGLLKSKLDPEKFSVDSAGTGNWHQGQAPDHRSIEVAKKYGVDISRQKARQISQSDFETFDYIYVMDSQNKIDVERLAPNQKSKNKISLILSEVPNPSSTLDVPDPYYGDDKDFEHVFKLLDEATEYISQKLK